MGRWVRRPKVGIWALAALVLVVGIAGGYLYTRPDTGPIPADLRPRLTFSPLILPTTAAYTTADYTLTTAEDNVQILSYRIQTKDGITVSVSEYPQPQQFSEIPEYKDRFLSNVAKQYDTVQTANGTIYLGRLTLQDDKQLGVLLEKGLLVFMNPDKDLDKTKWRYLGDQLEIQKAVD